MAPAPALGPGDGGKSAQRAEQTAEWTARSVPHAAPTGCQDKLVRLCACFRASALGTDHDTTGQAAGKRKARQNPTLRPSSQHGEDFGVEMFRDPSLRPGRHEPGQGSALAGYQRQSRRPPTHHGAHAPVSTRTSRRASSASRLSSSGSGPASRSSRKAWKASGEQSSSGLVTTTTEPGGKSAG